ncbi:uncharacterized protein LOC129760126, partial [Uranotaenia lowii]|uniref:uncharacterized protein LOC129760126 n=1 Tax=Uranotaenia lowii TaxID=190385 RepID=UPI00247B0F10
MKDKHTRRATVSSFVYKLSVGKQPMEKMSLRWEHKDMGRRSYKDAADEDVSSLLQNETQVEILKEVIEIHRPAGFHIRNWMSSDKSVMNKLGVEFVKPSKAMLPKKFGFERVLGAKWKQREYSQANDEAVFNEVRQKFRLPHLRVETRLARKRCMWCRLYKSTSVTPKMGPHLAVRMETDVRPFTYVGVDTFGPYQVKIGGSVAKRWVCHFTYLAVRAVHLEVVASLSDAYKKAIRRFIARRGTPQEINSDNGGQTLPWKFNPPAVPHMGDCWERMVREVKSSLGLVPIVRKLDDESFVTVLAEAEIM